MIALTLNLRQEGVEPCVVSFEHFFELLESFKAIEYRHVDVKEGQRDWVERLVAYAIVNIDAIQLNL